MTVLAACQEAATELTGAVVSTLFSTTDLFARELCLQANKAARAIARGNDWRRLMVLQSVTGDGAMTSFPMPDDYARMPVKGEMRLAGVNQTLTPARDLDQWLDIQLTGNYGVYGTWLLLGGTMQVLPALPVGEVVKFYYISNRIVSGDKTAFEADDDEFVLDETLLTLGIIWRWRAQKRLEYSEDLRNYEIAFAELSGADRGPRVLTLGTQRMPTNVDAAYPRSIVV